MIDNTERCGRARLLVQVYDSMAGVENGADFDQHLIDILSDLRHLAALRDVDFSRAVDMSLSHFEAETETEEEDC